MARGSQPDSLDLCPQMPLTCGYPMACGDAMACHGPWSAATIWLPGWWPPPWGSITTMRVRMESRSFAPPNQFVSVSASMYPGGAPGERQFRAAGHGLLLGRLLLQHLLEVDVADQAPLRSESHSSLFVVSYNEAQSVLHLIGQMRGSTMVGSNSAARNVMRDALITTGAPTASIALMVWAATVLRHTTGRGRSPVHHGSVTGAARQIILRGGDGDASPSRSATLSGLSAFAQAASWNTTGARLPSSGGIHIRVSAYWRASETVWSASIKLDTSGAF